MSVKGNTTDFKRLLLKYPEYETYFTDDQKFILDHADQLLVPDNVVLPYAPGDELDLSCDELWEHGTAVATPFDGLLALSDATELWGLSESALRKAISYGKLVNGVDVCKFGKQWVVSIDAMNREYGNRVG